MDTELKFQLKKEYRKRIKMRKRDFGCHYIKNYLSVKIQTYNGKNNNEFRRFNVLNFKSLTKNNATNKKIRGKTFLDLNEVKEWCKILGIKTSKMKYVELVKAIIKL